MAIETLRIQFEDDSHLDVRPNLFDQRNFERALRNNKAWGDLRDNALRLSAFRAWSAASRLGLITMSWDDFYEDPHTPVMSVTVAPDDETDDDDLEVDGVGKDTPAAPSTTS